MAPQIVNEFHTIREMSFTPVEQKMLKVLSDGRGHKTMELYNCLVDDLSPIRNVSVHVRNIRQKLRRVGEAIVAVKPGTYWVYFWKRRVTDGE